MARRDSNVEILYQDLLQRFSETRKLNMKLLEEKRELLLRMQSDKSSELRPHSRAQHDCENDIEFSVMDLSDTGSMGDAVSSFLSLFQLVHDFLKYIDHSLCHSIPT